MSAILTPPPKAAKRRAAIIDSPVPLLWACEEFHALGDAGYFRGRRAILIDGVILEQGPMNEPHATACELIDNELRRMFGPGWRFRSQLPLPLGQATEPMPDFSVMRGTPRDTPGKHPETALLVIEVADTTLKFDLRKKLDKYAFAGIAEYWVLDVNARKLHVFRDPDGRGYRTRMAFEESASVSPLVAPQSSVVVRDILP